MFKKSKNDNTFIGSDSKIEGNLTGKGILRIYGEVIGDIVMDGDVIIGESGEVNGNITSQTLLIGGTVIGDVIAREQLRVVSKGKLLGNIQTKSMIVDENAMFKGMSEMLTSEEIESQKEEENKVYRKK